MEQCEEVVDAAVAGLVADAPGPVGDGCVDAESHQPDPGRWQPYGQESGLGGEEEIPLEPIVFEESKGQQLVQGEQDDGPGRHERQKRGAKSTKPSPNKKHFFFPQEKRSVHQFLFKTFSSFSKPDKNHLCK